MPNGLYAVLTGDIVKSSSYPLQQRNELVSALDGVLERVNGVFQCDLGAPFYSYRRDSFQGVLKRIELAFRTAVLIRLWLRSGFPTTRMSRAADARIAIGIGTVDLLPKIGHPGGDGPAFIFSGKELDRMKGSRYLSIRSPWPSVDEEIETEFLLLDALLANSTAKQAEVLAERLLGKTQTSIAADLGVSQPAIRGRLDRAGSQAIESLDRRFQQLLEKNNVQVL